MRRPIDEPVITPQAAASRDEGAAGERAGGAKWRSVTILFLSQVLAMSLWFVSAAVLPEMVREFDLSPWRQAALSSAVQAGFVIGALAFAIFGWSDRYDPRRVFALSAITGGLVNALLLVIPADADPAIVLRFVTGALLAGVYPVAMKIVVGWGLRDRGFLVGALVGALTLGSASPHLMAYLGGSDWRTTVLLSSLAAVAAGIMCLWAGLGPYHGTAARFEPRAILLAWTNRRVRLAFAGYLGHMWELYVMWAWIGVAAAASYGASLPAGEAASLAKLTAFVAIAAGGLASIAAGFAADRVGKANVAQWAVAISGTAAIATALTFGGPPWLTFLVVIVWGLAVVPDSAQFSALVADAAPPEKAGSLLAFQTALGFTLTFFTVQAAPMAAASFGWPVVLAALALGPVVSVIAMARLKAMG
jgi:MFS family permease